MRPGEFPDSGWRAARQARGCSVDGTVERRGSLLGVGRIVYEYIAEALGSTPVRSSWLVVDHEMSSTDPVRRDAIVDIDLFLRVEDSGNAGISVY